MLKIFRIIDYSKYFHKWNLWIRKTVWWWKWITCTHTHISISVMNGQLCYKWNYSNMFLHPFIRKFQSSKRVLIVLWFFSSFFFFTFNRSINEDAKKITNLSDIYCRRWNILLWYSSYNKSWPQGDERKKNVYMEAGATICKGKRTLFDRIHQRFWKWKLSEVRFIKIVFFWFEHRRKSQMFCSLYSERIALQKSRIGNREE